MAHEQTRLTSAEIGNLWLLYMSNTAAVCFLSHGIKNAEDEKVKKILKHVCTLSKEYIKEVKGIFTKEDIPVPDGFSDKDVNLDAPRLFSDDLLLNYAKSFSKIGIGTYGLAYSLASRNDIRQLFKTCITKVLDLDEQILTILKEKGIYVRPPYISKPDRVNYIQKESFFTGFLGNRRPLTAPEITHLFLNMDTNELGTRLMIAFSQVAQDKKVKDLLWKGHNISRQHHDEFAKKLQDDNLPAPAPWDSGVTTITEAPFSDKLMMFMTSTLCASGTGNYGMAIAASPRTDIAELYMKLAGQIGLFAKDLVDLMVEKSWLEEPPQSEDREKLTGQK